MNKRIVRLAWLSVMAPAMFAGDLLGGMNRWTSSGPAGGSIVTMVADRTNTAILYAGTYGGGVYKTEDAGESWRPVNVGISDMLISSLLIRRDQSATLYAGTSRGTVVRTRDAGEHWTEVAHLSGYIRSLAFEGDRRSIYALPANGALMRSDDDGDTWKPLPADIQIVSLVALDGKLYALANRTVYVSADGGVVWSQLLERAPSLEPGKFDVSLIAVDEDHSNLVIASWTEVAQTLDGGSNWKLFPPSARLGEPNSSLAPYGHDVLVATINGGVFRYTDSSNGWDRVGEALNGAGVSLVVHTWATNTIGERIFAFRYDAPNLYVWPAEHLDWKVVRTGLHTSRTTAVAVGRSTIYAASEVGLSSLTEGSEVWKTISVSSSPTAKILDVDATGSGVVLATTLSGLHKSDDSGATWTSVATSGNRPNSYWPWPDASAIAPSDPKTMYAALVDGMSKSTDGGDSWFPIHNDIPKEYNFYYYGFGASTIEVDPTTADTVYVCYDHTYKTVDGGAHWTSISAEPMSALAIDRFNTSLLYAANYKGELLRSSDAGAQWEILDFHSPATALAVDPARPSVVYAGTADGQVYRSMNGGRSWKTINDGLTGAPILKMAVDSSGNRLYAATEAGLFEFDRDSTYLASAATHTVALRTYYGNFVSATDCGDSRVTANAASAGPCETFTLYDADGGTLLDGDRVYLQASNGSFVVAEHGGASACGGCESAVNADRFTAREWETFRIHKMGGIGPAIADGDGISLQSTAGDYIAAERGGSNGCACDSALNANRPAAREWETFTIILH